MSTIQKNFKLIAQKLIAHKLRSPQIFLFRKNSSCFWYFKVIFGLFRFNLKQICLFQLFWYTFLVCFGSFWNKSVRFGCFNIHFWFDLVYFETKLFVSVVLKCIGNTETRISLVTKMNRANTKQIMFRLFSVQTEFF